MSNTIKNHLKKAGDMSTMDIIKGVKDIGVGTVKLGFQSIGAGVYFVGLGVKGVSGAIKAGYNESKVGAEKADALLSSPQTHKPMATPWSEDDPRHSN